MQKKLIARAIAAATSGVACFVVFLQHLELNI